jgi:pyruvate/2-oxoacid:ferredoxin oxidoreductase beta subunit/Pyruvate/2-oxoacid:ferredoxin oxidoreductase delta subunit
MATVNDQKSMNEASDRDPHNSNSYGTLVDDGYKKISLPVLDVNDFNERIIRAYEDGSAEKDLPADLTVARSIVPAGTATLRDFSYVAPEIPEYIAEACTGCMDCVTLCPDTAILGKVVGENDWEARMEKLPSEDRSLFENAWCETRKYYDGPKKKTGEGGKFSIIIDPSKCKGCAECVTVCDDDALKMVNKTDDMMDEIQRTHRMFKEFGPSDNKYINDSLLIDMMLKEETHLYVGGAGSCAGCGEGTALRMMCSATGAKYGNDWGIIAATGCNTVYTSTYPYNPYMVPWSNSLFENAPAYAMGLRMRWDQKGWQDKPIWCIGGDGAMFDIGFQSLSRLLASGQNINVLVLDTQVYSNTGGQASTSTFMGQNSKMSMHGKVIKGKTERRKEIAQIAMMHPRTYVAQTTCAHVNHMYRCMIEAMEFDGPAVICVYTTCQPEHGVADNMATDQAKLAVDTRAFPMLVYDPRKGDTIKQRLSLQGNPAVNDDWWTNPKTGDVVDFIDFCRSEGRFGKHFDNDGNASDTLKMATQERLENWHQLQELAGVLDKKPAAKAKPAAVAAKPSGGNGQSSGLPKGYQAGAKIRYDGGEGWVNGVIDSVKPVVITLADNTEIEISPDVMKEAIALGLVALQ